MDYNKLSDEELETRKNKIRNLSYIDLLLLKKDMIQSASIYNKIYYFVEEEIARREKEREEQKTLGSR